MALCLTSFTRLIIWHCSPEWTSVAKYNIYTKRSLLELTTDPLIMCVNLVNKHKQIFIVHIIPPHWNDKDNFYDSVRTYPMLLISRERKEPGYQFPWSSYQIRDIAGCAYAGNVGNIFPATDFKENRQLEIAACITALARIANLWWRGKRARHSACATRNSTYLVRGLWYCFRLLGIIRAAIRQRYVPHTINF